MSWKVRIEGYVDDLLDTTVSPFEALDALRTRDEIEKHRHELTVQETKLLDHCDREVKANADTIYHHLKGILDFKTKNPAEGWWWRIDLLTTKDTTYTPIQDRLA